MCTTAARDKSRNLHAYQVIVPAQGLLERPDRLAAILAMIPDEEARANLTERLKVQVPDCVLQRNLLHAPAWQARCDGG